MPKVFDTQTCRSMIRIPGTEALRSKLQCVGRASPWRHSIIWPFLAHPQHQNERLHAPIFTKLTHPDYPRLRSHGSGQIPDRYSPLASPKRDSGPFRVLVSNLHRWAIPCTGEDPQPFNEPFLERGCRKGVPEKNNSPEKVQIGVKAYYDGYIASAVNGTKCSGLNQTSH